MTTYSWNSCAEKHANYKLTKKSSEQINSSSSKAKFLRLTSVRENTNLLVSQIEKLGINNYRALCHFEGSLARWTAQE